MIRYKKAFYVLLIGLLMMSLIGCGDPSGVDTGAEPGSAKSEAQSSATGEAKKVAINEEFIINGLKITIGEVQVEKDCILIGMTIKNESSNKLSFFPDQGCVVVGDIQLEGNLFRTEGDISGDFHPGVEKSGVAVFTVPEGKTLNPKEITEIVLHAGDVFNEATFAVEPFDANLALK